MILVENQEVIAFFDQEGSMTVIQHQNAYRIKTPKAPIFFGEQVFSFFRQNDSLHFLFTIHID